MTLINLYRCKRKNPRYLEIGPGLTRLDGFETINIRLNFNTDYVLDASNKLPFADNTFDVIYASHVLEHIAWFKTKEVLEEWIRILKPGGKLEIWVPDALKIARAFVDAETYKGDAYQEDAWYRFNPDKDPCVWFAGRMFSYGDGSKNYNHENWHRAIFSYRYLEKLLLACGIREVIRLSPVENRGKDIHGWINQGVLGCK